MRIGRHTGEWRAGGAMTCQMVHMIVFNRGDDHGPMDSDAIGAAAAMEAFKQTAAASKAPAGGFQAGKASGGPSSKPGRTAPAEEEEETTAERAGPAGGLQDKLVRGVNVNRSLEIADGDADVACHVSSGQVVRQEERRIKCCEQAAGQGTRCVLF
jgi:hypothetical protein